MATPIGFCVICKHRIKKNICKAFPKGIPIEILTGEFDHTKPYPGDNGIQFEDVSHHTPLRRIYQIRELLTAMVIHGWYQI